MKLFRLKHKGLSGTPSGEGRELLNRFFVESLIEYLKTENREASVQLLDGQMPAFLQGNHGKPYFESKELSNIYFSISHTRDFAGIAMNDSEIGFDCENISARNYPKERFEKIANRVFSACEIRYCFDDENNYENRFFEIWTAKEAYSKYTGNGFSEDFRSFSVMDMIGKNIQIGTIDEASIMYAICTGDAK